MERSDVKLTVNAARGKRRRIPVKQVLRRSFLEPDQIRVLLEAAALTEQRAREHTGKRALPRKAIIAMLVMGALRISELCAARRRWLNLAARVFDNGDSKTAAGYREVDLLFDELIDILSDHLARTDGKPGDLLFGAYTRSGRSREQLSPDNVRRMLDEVVEAANEMCEERGIAPLGHCTPHTLRRTNISLLCIATKGNLKYVMEQVGHTDPKLTLRIYAQLLKRQDAEQYRAAANELLGISPQDAAADAADEVPDTVPADWSE
jgi:integrase